MKRKFSIFLNVAVLALCVCAIAIGVYSAKTASLNVSGTVGFTAHNCDVDISGYIYGHSTTVDGEPIAEPANDSEKKYLTYGASNTKATETAPLKISGTTGELKFGDVFFSDMGDSGEVEPITIELTITNKSKFAVLLDDNTTVAEGAGYTAVCSNPLHVLYIDSDEEKTTTLQYVLRPAKDSNGNYVNISTPVTVTLGMNFSKIDTDIVGNTADGWTVDSSGVLTAVPTIENYGSDTLIIPAMVDGTAITQIGNDDIPENIIEYKKVVITKDITSIGSSVFSNCSGLTSITIPNSVTSIGDYAFTDCSSLTSITIPEGVTSIGDSAFFDCSGLTSITIPEGVTSIGGGAFFGCSGLTSVTIPNSVISIGDAAFSYCSGLTSVTIPNSVTNIGGSAFSDCSGLSSITVDSENTVYDSRDNCNAIIEISSNTLIAGCKNTVIPSTVTSIGSSGFSTCSGLTSITIPEGVTSIGDYAFSNCRSLSSVNFGESSQLTSIGSSAFSYCSGLTSVTIPNSVTSIGGSAFSGCSGLSSITVDSENTVYDSRDNCNAIIEISSNTLIAGCKNTVIPSTVTSIGNYAFYGCSSLTSISFGESSQLTSIGNYAFYNCTSLTSITIPSTVTSIGSSAFFGCTDLTSATFETTTSTWTVKSGSTVKNSSVDVSTPATNATNLKSTYGSYSWSKNS